MRNFSTLSRLLCSRTGERFAADRLLNLSPTAAPLLAEYDLKLAAHTLVRSEMANRPNTMWRYHEVLPVRSKSEIISLGEGMTPLIPATSWETAWASTAHG